jgi:predicted CopG family antitoxin
MVKPVLSVSPENYKALEDLKKNLPDQKKYESFNSVISRLIEYYKKAHNENA